MGNGIIAFAVAAGAAGWIYSKLSRSTGGNTKSAGIAAIIIFMGFVQLLIAFILKVREKTHRKN